MQLPEDTVAWQCAGHNYFTTAVRAPCVLPHVVQDEFKFYMKDASSKLLLVPVKGNREAEKAASSLNMPVASVALSQTGGERLPPQNLLLPGHDCADCSLIRASGR